jgi:hypothetical protein
MEAGTSIGQSSAPGPSSSRRLTTHQKSVLIQVLLTFPDESVGVCYSSGSDDAAAYAEDFLTIFKAINWSADRSEPTGALPAPSSGLLIALPAQKIPPSAEALRDALRIYHLETAIIPDQSTLCGTHDFVFAVTAI